METWYPTTNILPIFLNFYPQPSFGFLVPWVQLWRVHILGRHATLSFCVWIILLGVMSSKHVSVVADSRLSFFLKSWIISYIYICIFFNHIFHFFIPHGHWSCFHILAVVHDAAMSMEGQIPLKDTDFVSLGNRPRSCVTVSCEVSMFKLLRTPRTVSHSACISLYSH